MGPGDYQTTIAQEANLRLSTETGQERSAVNPQLLQELKAIDMLPLHIFKSYPSYVVQFLAAGIRSVAFHDLILHKVSAVIRL